jgi:putative effector of murein hydrolase LrgA (UPF0299 family)
MFFEQNPLLLIPFVVAIVEAWSLAKRAYWSLRAERRSIPFE